MSAIWNPAPDLRLRLRGTGMIIVWIECIVCCICWMCSLLFDGRYFECWDYHEMGEEYDK